MMSKAQTPIRVVFYLAVSLTAITFCSCSDEQAGLDGKKGSVAEVVEVNAAEKPVIQESMESNELVKSKSGFDSESKPESDQETKFEMVEIGKIKWYVQYDEALIVAERLNKPLWLHFGENPG